MKKNFKNFMRMACLVFVACIVYNLNIVQASAVEIQNQTRYSGDDRFKTAVAVSKGGWTSSQNVVLSVADNFPDALSGVPFAYLKDAPILLTNKDSVPQETFNEIKRLGAKNIYILGSSGVISDTLKNNLTKSGYNLVRLSGADRFETSIKIANEVNKKNSLKTAIVTVYDDYPDALAISPYAAINSIPILYTETNSLNDKTKAWLKSNGITKVIITGSTGVVSQNVENQLKSLGITVQRIAGADRYLTTLNVVKTFQNEFNNDVFLARGSDFPDALAGGVLAAKMKTPILLAEKTEMNSEVESYISGKTSLKVFILGSAGVIQENVKSYFKKLIVVDPGHDYGGDYGAVATHNGVKYEETVLTMQVAEKLKSSLEARGYRVLLTRQPGEKPISNNVKESLKKRTDFANSQKADLFISIHFDKSTSSTATGVSSHYSTYKPNIDNSGVVTGNDPNGWYSGVEIDTTPSNAAKVSKTLADKIATDLSTKMGYVNRLSHDHNLNVTVNTNMPSVLVECGFLSNPDEAKRSANPTNQKNIAETIAESIKQVLK